jgi:Spy/CpxP family protein refolding chaperone
MNASHRIRRPLVVAALAGLLAAPAFARPHEGGAGEKSCEHHEGNPHGGAHGPRLGIHHLLEGVELRADQREAVMQLHKEAMNDRTLVEAATKAYREELAKGVRSGSFDSAALDKLLAKTTEELAALPPVHVKMLARLHAILDKAQRAQVAEKLAAMPPHEGGKHGGGKHAGKHGAHAGGEHGGHGMHALERFFEDLDLSRAQREAIAKAFHTRMRAQHEGPPPAAMHAEMEKRHRALAERFRAESFAVTDADRIPPAMASRRLAHLTTFAVVATPELSVNQRLKVAERIEAGRTDDEP